MSNEPEDVEAAPASPADTNQEATEADPFEQPSFEVETRVPVPGKGPVAVGPGG
jgi:hypothetical protein